MNDKKSDVSIYEGAYHHIVVAHLMGELEAMGKIKTGFSDYEEYAKVVNGIVDGWINHQGIKNKEEEGHIMKYASRILHEAFFTDGGCKKEREEVF